MDSRGELSVSLISLLISSTWGAPMFFGTEMRTVPDFLKGKARTLCAADGSWYSCESEYCRHVRPCPSEPGLLACSCTKPTLAERKELLSKQAASVFFSSPCLKVDVHMHNLEEEWELCEDYLSLPLEVPKSSSCPVWRLPKLYHAVGKDASPPPEVVRNAATNPEFELRYFGDAIALEYVRKRCGEVVASAYQCFVAPAFRADIFRYCVLYADGGVYLDTDISLLVRIPEVVDMCDGATLGYDIPQFPMPPRLANDTVAPGMQMKILGGEAGHPLFKCMLDRIIENVRRRSKPRYSLKITGPALLARCYRKTRLDSSSHIVLEGWPAQVDATGWPRGFFSSSGPDALAMASVNASASMYITYRDSRGAMWPYAGMMGGKGLLAFETPTTENFPPVDLVGVGKNSKDIVGGGKNSKDLVGGSHAAALRKLHYHELMMQGTLYTETCAIKHHIDKRKDWCYCTGRGNQISCSNSGIRYCASQHHCVTPKSTYFRAGDWSSCLAKAKVSIRATANFDQQISRGGRKF